MAAVTQARLPFHIRQESQSSNTRLSPASFEANGRYSTLRDLKGAAEPDKCAIGLRIRSGESVGASGRPMIRLVTANGFRRGVKDALRSGVSAESRQKVGRVRPNYVNKQLLRNGRTCPYIGSHCPPVPRGLTHRATLLVRRLVGPFGVHPAPPKRQVVSRFCHRVLI